MGLPVIYALDIVGLSKKFKRRSHRKADYTTIKSVLLSGLSRLLSKYGEAGHYTAAVEDLTLRIPRGSAVGIIGQNGSGKSTLLKLITGIYKADRGVIRVHGRMAALIELGAGFHPDFTGRENVWLGGVMHGLSRRQIAERFEEIVHFAELEEVIDEPVRTYSSGMFMRLAFSLAIHTNPDILLMDEVLAVGDAAFSVKCRERLADLRRKGKTLLLVSHDLAAVERWCDEVLWLHAGRVRDRGEPRRVIDHYRQFVEQGEEAGLRQEQMKQAAGSAGGSDSVAGKGRGDGEVATHHGSAAAAAAPQRWGSREVEISGVYLRSTQGEVRLLFHPADGVKIEIEYRVHDKGILERGDVVFGISINRSDGLVVFGTNTHLEKIKVPPLGERGLVVHEIGRLALLEGNYSLDVAVHREDGYPYDYRKGMLKFAVRCPAGQIGVYLPEHKWSFHVS